MLSRPIHWPLRQLLLGLALFAAIAFLGCSSGEPPGRVENPSPSDAESKPEWAGQQAAPEALTQMVPSPQASAGPGSDAVSRETGSAESQAGSAVANDAGSAKVHDAGAAIEPDAKDKAATAPASPTADPPADRPKLDELLAKLVIPPPWLEQVQTQYDTSKPWKDARLEIRRLLGFGRVETHRVAIKLTWIYLQKGDIGDGHEYPMYTFLGGEPVWSVRAHEEFLAKPHENTPIHAYLTLASLYSQYREFDKAKTTLDAAMNGLPPPPWDVMRKADVLDAYGDLYAAWGNTDEAKRYYAEAAALYPTAKPPYGGHLLPRRAVQVQSKLDLLTFQSVAAAELRDGQYRDKALGYAGDIDVTLTVREGKIADIRLKHEEKIDQNACVLIPQRIIDAQSLQVDGISGATVTKDAVVHGVYRCLRQAGLR